MMMGVSIGVIRFNESIEIGPCGATATGFACKQLGHIRRSRNQFLINRLKSQVIARRIRGLGRCEFAGIPVGDKIRLVLDIDVIGDYAMTGKFHQAVRPPPGEFIVHIVAGRIFF